MNGEALPLSQIVFFAGSDLLPGDLPLSLENIRRWAFEKGAIYDAEAQLVLDERIQEITKYISARDQLGIAIAIERTDSGITYYEFPFLSIRSLIQRGDEASIVYLRMLPGQVRFGFRLSDCSDEFCSVSASKLVVQKFSDLFKQMSDAHRVRQIDEWTQEITVEGTISAKFVRAGRGFDVTLSVAH